MAAASFTATWFITPQPHMKIQSGLRRRICSQVAFCSWPGMIDREDAEIVAELLGEHLERRDGLLAVGAVVMHQRDLLAREVLHASFLFTDVTDQCRGLAPVGGGEVEGPFEHPAVRGRGLSVAHGVDGNLVDRRLGNEQVGHPRAPREDDGGAGGALVLQPLVALHPLLGVVLELAFLPGDLDAVDAAVALVDEPEVVDRAVGGGYAVGGVGAGAVHEQWEELLVLGGGVAGVEARQHHRGARARS